MDELTTDYIFDDGAKNSFTIVIDFLTSYIYAVFSKSNKEQNPIDLFAIAVLCDLNTYVSHGDLDGYDLFMGVKDLFITNKIILEGDEYNLDNKFQIENSSFLECVTKVCLFVLCTAFMIDNRDMEKDEIVDIVLSCKDKIQARAENRLKNIDVFKSDYLVRRVVSMYMSDNLLMTYTQAGSLAKILPKLSFDDYDSYEFIDFDFCASNNNPSISKNPIPLVVFWIISLFCFFGGIGICFVSLVIGIFLIIASIPFMVGALYKTRQYFN